MTKVLKSLIILISLVVLLAGGRIGAWAGEVAGRVGGAEWYVREVAAGVTVRSHRFDDLFGSPQLVHVVEADMEHPGVRLAFLARPGQERATVPSLVRGHDGVVAAVNGNFFDRQGSVQHLKIDGELLAATRSERIDDRGGLTIDASGRLHARHRGPVGGWETLDEPHIMATNIPLVIDGEPFPFGTGRFYEVDRHPRTLAGTTEDGRALLVIVDGRSAIAAGMTYTESAALMIALGAPNAVNLDGGGSSTMWDAGLPGNGVANLPSDGSLRPVANAVAVLSAPPQDAPPPFDALRAPVHGRASPLAPIPVTAPTGSAATVSISFLNAGSESWLPGQVALHTSEPFGRESSFAHPGWPSPQRPAQLEGTTVPPGGKGTFTFSLQVPEVSEPLAVEESFVLVDPSGRPFGPHQNRLSLTVLPPPDPTDIVVESRRPGASGGGKTDPPSYEESGRFADTVSKSRADGPAMIGAGARFSTEPGATAAFRPEITVAGEYNVHVTLGTGTNNHAKAAFTIINAGDDIDGSVHLTHTDRDGLVNRWKLLAPGVPLEAGREGGILFRNIDGGQAVGGRFVMDAVRFELVREFAER